MAVDRLLRHRAQVDRTVARLAGAGRDGGIALALHLQAAGIVGLDLIVTLLRGDQIAVGGGAVLKLVDAEDDRGEYGQAQYNQCEHLADRRAALLVRLDRFEPGQPLLVAQVQTVRHHFISETATTPMMLRPLRIICATALAKARRARVAS
ncbi:hypothetical protein WR25_05233 [Diploscapter pachys]|uniref:Uncharacterized protein n=1 Tax=Diploscapter pachys TaxID=2018661 RepID=A0A2A2M491_9BILA|nr:hypothetical protein WR25_05233 [Diploscapter pachys]